MDVIRSAAVPVRGERAAAEKVVKEKQLVHTVYDTNALGALRPKTAMASAVTAASSKPPRSSSAFDANPNNNNNAKSSAAARKQRTSKAPKVMVPNGMRSVGMRRTLTTTTTTIGMGEEHTVQFKQDAQQSITDSLSQSHIEFQRHQHTPMGVVSPTVM